MKTSVTHPVIHDALRHGINAVAQIQKAIMSEETKPENPPAFPFDNHLGEGMSLRDYFAAKAMQALICKVPFATVEGGNVTEAEAEIMQRRIATIAWEYSDEMLAERLKP